MLQTGAGWPFAFSSCILKLLEFHLEGGGRMGRMHVTSRTRRYSESSTSCTVHRDVGLNASMPYLIDCEPEHTHKDRTAG